MIVYTIYDNMRLWLVGNMEISCLIASHFCFKMLSGGLSYNVLPCLSLQLIFMLS